MSFHFHSSSHLTITFLSSIPLFRTLHCISLSFSQGTPLPFFHSFHSSVHSIMSLLSFPQFRTLHCIIPSIYQSTPLPFFHPLHSSEHSTMSLLSIKVLHFLSSMHSTLQKFAASLLPSINIFHILSPFHLSELSHRISHSTYQNSTWYQSLINFLTSIDPS